MCILGAQKHVNAALPLLWMNLLHYWTDQHYITQQGSDVAVVKVIKPRASLLVDSAAQLSLSLDLLI